jgi:hypothetical protein
MLRKIITLCLILGLLSSMNTPAYSAGSNYTDPELARAVELGFGEYRTDNPTVAFNQFMTMLDRTVELADSTKLVEWQSVSELQKARASNMNMTRSDGIFAAFCAAETLGGDYARYNCKYWGDQWSKLGGWEDKTGQNYNPNEDVFGGEYMHQTPGILFNPQDDYEERYSDAIVFSFARASHLNSRPIFDIDVQNNSMRTEDAFLYSEALLAALRLYDSGSNTTSPKFVNAPIYTSERYITDADKKIIANAEARKQAILNSPTEVTVTGTKYYVSNTGDDRNDGKSQNKAWATVDKVNETDLKPGDGVFFERGGTWRNVFLWGRTGVTYSAYGEGEKPQLLGSPENGANPDYWKRVPGTDNIWQYHRKMYEVGLMVVNDMPNLTDKYIAYWDISQQKYVASLDFKTPFSLGLLENHQFFSDIDLKGLEGGQFGLSGEAAIAMASAGDVTNAQGGTAMLIDNARRDGTLFFRCDEGNPGEIYQSIEFAMATFSNANPYEKGKDTGGYIMSANRPAESVTVDNLCFKYNNGGVFLYNGSTVQNCEFAFIGGTVMGYLNPEKMSFTPSNLRDMVWTDDGVAILFSASNVTVTNNYAHDIVANAYNIEQMLDDVYKNIHINGNLFERCGTGSSLNNFFPNDDPKITRYQDVYVKDNYWLYNGYFSDYTINVFYPLHKFEFYHPQQYKNINYTNNVFYLSKGSLFDLSSNATLDAINFSGNTYAQNNGGVILRDDTKNRRRLFFDENAEQTIRELTGDKNAIVLPVSYPPITN